MTAQQLAPLEATVDLAGLGCADSSVVVRLSRHAAVRYHERVRPSLDAAAAAQEFVRLMTNAVLRTEPPAWLEPTIQRPAFYICIGDIAMPADPDCVSRDRLVVRTVLVRGTASRVRGSRARKRRFARVAKRRSSRDRRVRRDMKRRRRGEIRAKRRATTNRGSRRGKR